MDKLEGDLKEAIVHGQQEEWKNVNGTWGYLEKEPCRFCRQTQCVYFRADDSPTDLTTAQAVRCTKCGRDWEADSPCA
jgi:DNA-directed RNA polymerase subunit M/transcription elongation factor TFIIS